MIDVVTLTCLSCGGKLEITKDIDRFACAHCGTEHIVRRGGGIVSLDLVLDELAEIEAKVNRTASKVAIGQLEEEIEELEKESAKNNGAIGQAIIWGVAGILGIVVLPVLTAGAPGFTIIGVLVCLLFIFASGFTAKGSYKKGKHLKESIWKKRAEIRHQREIMQGRVSEQP